MTKLLVTTTLMLTLLVSTLMAEEKVMECSIPYYYPQNNEPIVFKLKRSFLWGQKYYFRYKGNWEEYCFGNKNNTMPGKSIEVIPKIKKIKDNAISCEYDIPKMEVSQSLELDFDVLRYSLEERPLKRTGNYYADISKVVSLARNSPCRKIR